MERMRHKTSIIRGLILFAIQFLLIEFTLYAGHGIPWNLSILLPTAGISNLAIAWFLYLRKDNFLGPLDKKNKEIPQNSLFALPPGSEKEAARPLCEDGQQIGYEAAFILSGLFLLTTASLLYFLLGTGKSYYL